MGGQEERGSPSSISADWLVCLHLRASKGGMEGDDEGKRKEPSDSFADRSKQTTLIFTPVMVSVYDPRSLDSAGLCAKIVDFNLFRYLAYVMYVTAPVLVQAADYTLGCFLQRNCQDFVKCAWMHTYLTVMKSQCY